jgi:hypothetical protein
MKNSPAQSKSPIEILELDRGRTPTRYEDSMKSGLVDMDKVRRWPVECESHHSEKCSGLTSTRTCYAATTLTLIDVQNQCLITMTGKVRYVALSYVWGTIPGTLEANTQNFGSLCTPGSLAKSEFSSRIPRTISDAIFLIHELGLQYLWVDRLCIIQDDPRIFNEQLSQMASIYANAYFTIVAVDGDDANHGLRGVGGLSSPRACLPRSFRFSDKVTLSIKNGVESFQRTWHTRAWTFQERALSKRNLVFVDGTVYWECRAHIRYELNSTTYISPDSVAGLFTNLSTVS